MCLAAECLTTDFSKQLFRLFVDEVPQTNFCGGVNDIPLY